MGIPLNSFGWLVIEAPQDFVIRQECQKVAGQCGYRRALGEADGFALWVNDGEVQRTRLAWHPKQIFFSKVP